MKKPKGFINPIILEDCLNILKLVDLENLHGKNVLLTGANGFLGQHIAYLIQVANERGLNCNLYCISFHEPSEQIGRILPNDRILWEACDLTKAFPAKWLAIRFDYIFHAACPGQPAQFMADPFRTIELNTNVTRKLLEIAKTYRARFVFFSSADVYGEMPEGVDEVSETYNGNCSTLNPRAVYRESKRMGETICSIFKRDFDIDVVILRILSLYGPGISLYDTRVFGNFVRSALMEGKVKMLDRGESRKALGYIADAITMIMQIAFNGHDLVYNVGGVDFITIKKLAEVVAKYCGVPYEMPQVKSSLQHLGSDPRCIRVNLFKTLRLFSSFSFTSLQQGIAKFVEWNRQEFVNK